VKDVSFKVKTLRVATAQAVVKASPSTLAAIRGNTVPKGDPLAVAKVAAVQAAKNTSQIIPYCHPLPIDYVSCNFDLGADSITVVVEVKAVYKTGVEMEALTAASVAAS
jgi:cyclic pyranopterin phosphate synthase